MRTYIRNALIVSVALGLVGVGCSSSDDSSPSADGGSSGKGGTSSGGSSSGGSAGKGGTGGTSVGGTTSGGDAGATSAGSGGTALGGAAGDDGNNAGGAAGDSGAPGVQACNTLVQAAPAIMTTHTADPEPVLAQGNIQPGIYYLTSYTFYDGATGPGTSVAATAEATVNNKTVTLNGVGSGGLIDTIAIVMGTPPTAAPTSITPICSTDPKYEPFIGQDVKGVFSYGVTGAAQDTLTLYLSTLKIKQVYQLQP